MRCRLLVVLLAAMMCLSCVGAVCADGAVNANGILAGTTIIITFPSNTIVSPHGGASGNTIHLRTSTVADVRGSIDADLGWTGMNIDFKRGRVHSGKIPAELYLKRFVKHTLYVRCRPKHGSWEEQRRKEVLYTWNFYYGSADTIAPSVREGSPGVNVLFDGTTGSKYVSFLVIESGTGIKMVRGCTENTKFHDMIHKFNFRRTTPMGAIYVGNVTVRSDTKTLYIACQDKAGNISPAFEWSKIASKGTAKSVKNTSETIAQSTGLSPDRSVMTAGPDESCFWVVDTKADVCSDFQVLQVEDNDDATCTVTAQVFQLDGLFSSSGDSTYRFRVPEELLESGYRLVKRQVISATDGTCLRWEELNPLGYISVLHLTSETPDSSVAVCTVNFTLAKECTIPEPLPSPALIEPASERIELARGGNLVFRWDGEGTACRFVIVDEQSGRCLFKRQVFGTSLSIDSSVFSSRCAGIFSWSVSQADDHLVFSPYSSHSLQFTVLGIQSPAKRREH